MSIAFKCTCGAPYRVAENLGGKKIRCKKCGNIVVIPAAAPQPEIEEDRGEYDVADSPAITPPSYAPPAYSAPAYSARSENLPRPMGGATYASNPGQTRVQWIRYVISFPLFPLITVVAAIVGVVVGMQYNTVGYVLGGTVLFLQLSSLREIRQKFISGDVNPGIVICKSPWLVAVLVDLSQTGAVRPAIKILSQPLGRMAGGPPEIGTRVATASFYAGQLGESTWSDVSPVVINCVTGNEYDIARVMATIPEDDWQRLESTVARMETRSAGLYTLWDGNKKGAQLRVNNLKAAFALLLIGAAVTMFIINGPKGKSRPSGNSPAPQPAPAEVEPNPTANVPAQDKSPVVARPAEKPPVAVTPGEKPPEIVPPIERPPVVSPPSEKPPVVAEVNNKSPTAPETTPPATVTPPVEPVVPKPPVTPPAVVDAPKTKSENLRAYESALRSAAFQREILARYADKTPQQVRQADFHIRTTDKNYARYKADLAEKQRKCTPEELAQVPDELKQRLETADENARLVLRMLVTGQPIKPAPNKPEQDKPDPVGEKVAAIGTKVEVQWGNKWWPATIRKRDGGKTLVHYEGWSDAGDEWVTPERIRPLPK